MLTAADREKRNPHVRPVATTNKSKMGTAFQPTQAHPHQRTSAAPMTKTPCQSSRTKPDTKNTATPNIRASLKANPNRFQTSRGPLGDAVLINVVLSNAERSHAGPLTLSKAECALLALAAVIR